MKGVLKPLAVILAVGGIYFWGIKGEISTINGKAFNTKGKDSEVARTLSTKRQHVQQQGKDIAVSSAPETELDDPEEIAGNASLDPILDESPLEEPLTEPETGVDDPEAITGDASLLDPILDESPPEEPLTEPEIGVGDPDEISDNATLEPILDELPAAEPLTEPETGVGDPAQLDA